MKAWDGKREIARDDLVRVEFRCGQISHVYPAKALRWRWGDEPMPFDIVAYAKEGEV